MDSSITYTKENDRLCCFIRDITEKKEKEQKIEFLSFHDPLTGLYNRAFFEEECYKIESIHKHPITIIMGDVNGLKLINDIFGHKYGDQLLCTIAGIVQRCSRPDSIVARIGGDEFCILMQCVDHLEIQKICDAIYAECETTKLELDDGYYHPSISLGYAIMQEEKQLFWDAFRNAENSMYKRKLLESRSAHSSLISSIRTTLFEKSLETREHADRISSMARKVGEELHLSPDQLNDLELLGTLHDIGKIGVDDHILGKKGVLTEEEWVEIRKHPEIGYRIASGSMELKSIAEGILCHHERWDGKGYPQGLSGESIPLSARIVAVVDAFDAIINDRCYHQARSVREALQEIKNSAGKQFDPMVVQALLTIWQDNI